MALVPVCYVCKRHACEFSTVEDAPDPYVVCMNCTDERLRARARRMAEEVVERIEASEPKETP
jgi:hypothetical protein